MLKTFSTLTLLAILLAYPNKYINWDKTKKLQYTDFKGPVDKSSPNAGYTTYNFQYTGTVKKNDLRISSKVLFDTEESWLKTKSSSLLAHEQLHFDIAELYNRLFKHKCRSFTFSKADFKSQLGVFFEETEQACDVLQKKYDAETNHSVDKQKQSIWAEKILKKLEESTQYSDSLLIVKIQ